MSCEDEALVSRAYECVGRALANSPSFSWKAKVNDGFGAPEDEGRFLGTARDKGGVVRGGK